VSFHTSYFCSAFSQFSFHLPSTPVLSINGLLIFLCCSSCGSVLSTQILSFSTSLYLSYLITIYRSAQSSPKFSERFSSFLHLNPMSFPSYSLKSNLKLSPFQIAISQIVKLQMIFTKVSFATLAAIVTRSIKWE